MKNCPHCNLSESKDQPQCGTHCWTLVYDCGYSEVWCGGDEASGVESNCPNQTYEGYTPIHDYVKKHEIEIPKIDNTYNYSDLYLDAYNTISDRILHTWETGTKNSKCKHMMWHYNDIELDKLFKLISIN